MKKIIILFFSLIFINTVVYADVEIPETIRIKMSDGTISELDLEEYLYGVVQSEIGVSYKSVEMEKAEPVPMEALKAQAVASRTYAVYNIVNKASDVEYHVANSGQVYKNVNVNERIKQAVDETRGQIVLYDGKVANTFFSTTSGGHTESCQNVWTASLPYLVGVDDKYEINVKNQTNWVATYTKEDLAKLFPSLGTIKDIEIVKRSENDRVTELKITGTNGTKTYYKNNIRIAFGSNKLRSQWFDVEKDGTSFVFTGKGFGHGVGMSQNGAIGMAINDFTYDEIIKWYYTGVTIQGFDEEYEEEEYFEEAENYDEEGNYGELYYALKDICTTNWLLKYFAS